jgi:hypothetical protein
VHGVLRHCCCVGGNALAVVLKRLLHGVYLISRWETLEWIAFSIPQSVTLIVTLIGQRNKARWRHYPLYIPEFYSLTWLAMHQGNTRNAKVLSSA